MQYSFSVSNCYCRALSGVDLMASTRDSRQLDDRASKALALARGAGRGARRQRMLRRWWPAVADTQHVQAGPRSPLSRLQAVDLADGPALAMARELRGIPGIEEAKNEDGQERSEAEAFRGMPTREIGHFVHELRELRAEQGALAEAVQKKASVIDSLQTEQVFLRECVDSFRNVHVPAIGSLQAEQRSLMECVVSVRNVHMPALEARHGCELQALLAETGKCCAVIEAIRGTQSRDMGKLRSQHAAEIEALKISQARGEELRNQQKDIVKSILRDETSKGHAEIEALKRAQEHFITDLRGQQHDMSQEILRKVEADISKLRDDLLQRMGALPDPLEISRAAIEPLQRQLVLFRQEFHNLNDTLRAEVAASEEPAAVGATLGAGTTEAAAQLDGFANPQHLPQPAQGAGGPRTIGCYAHLPSYKANMKALQAGLLDEYLGEDDGRMGRTAAGRPSQHQSVRAQAVVGPAGPRWAADPDPDLSSDEEHRAVVDEHLRMMHGRREPLRQRQGPRGQQTAERFQQSRAAAAAARYAQSLCVPKGSCQAAFDAPLADGVAGVARKGGRRCGGRQGHGPRA